MRNTALVLFALLAACRDAPEAPATAPSATSAVAESSAAPSPPPSPTPAPAERFQALGTEPFWSVEVEGEQLRYVTPENQPGTAFAAKRARENSAQVWAGTLEGQSFVLRIAPGTCSDGMSDTVYAWTAQVAFGDTTLSGCARLR
ncbi:MAG: COG3650 family protein [Novosphingobium sp.]